MNEPISEKSIFEAAIDAHTPQERAAYLDKACGDNAELRREVEGLLAAHDRLGSFAQDVAFPTPGATSAPPPRNERPGTVIGPYKLLQQLGEGGMGVVFMAEQTQPVRRRVALKLIKAGMDSSQVIARFESERQALAMMDHVNIARALDAGTTESGLPYFVMELVHGVPISKYCDDNQLTPRQRLELFIPVCRAIQHAHQKGIIHRDIKPTNVMITLYDGKPVPKVIDFGIAKAMEQKLTERTLFTQYGTMVGTLEHMSPEQAEMSGLGIDTRSDIYSLGVLLYELLTGSTPLSNKRVREAAYAEILRVIKEEEPPRPSTRLSASGDLLASISAQRRMEPAKLAKAIRGELDWIVMRALEKDRNRRYDTASAFAADVERYLNDEAVQACPPSGLYRFGKFARRNKVQLAFAMLILVFLVLAGVGVGWTSRDRAVRRAQSARQVSESLMAARTLLAQDKPEQARQKLAEANAQLGPDRAALSALAKEVDALDVELARFDQFFALIDSANEAQIPAGGTMVIMSGDRVRGDTSISATQVSDAKPGGEIPALLQALGLYEVLDRADWSSRLERGVLEKGQIEQIRGAAYEALLVLSNDLIQRQADHRSEQNIAPDAAARQTLIYLQKAEAAHAPTSQLYRIRTECWKALNDDKAVQVDAQRVSAIPPTMALDHYLLGLRAYYAKNETDAVSEFEAALRLEPTHYWSLMWLGMSLCDLGEGDKEFEGAVLAFTGCISRRPEHSHVYFCRGLAYSKLGRHDEALADFTRSIELNPKFASAWSSRGATYVNLQQFDKAVADATKALELNPKLPPAWDIQGAAYDSLGQRDRALADLNQAIELNPTTAEFWQHRGTVYSNMKQYDKAVDDFNKAIELAPKPARALIDRGMAYDSLGQTDKAMADLNKAVELDAKLPAAWNNRGILRNKLQQVSESIADFSKAIELDPKLAMAWSNRGHARGQQGQYDVALADEIKAIELDPNLKLAWHNIGNIHYSQGRTAEALEDFGKAIELEPTDAGSWMGRGRIYELSGEIGKAIADYSKAIELDPKRAMAWNNRGAAYDTLLQMDKALPDVCKAIELDPKLAFAWANRGAVYVNWRKPDKAIPNLDKAIELDPKLAPAWRNRGAAYEMLGKNDKAIADLSKAIELDPKLTEAWGERGNLQVSLAHYPEAIADLSKAIELDPSTAQSWNGRAIAYERSGKTNEAIADYCKAIELDPKHEAGWFNRGTLYHDLRQQDKALADLSKAVEFNPKNAGNWHARGLVYGDLGQFDKAIADFSMALDLDPKAAVTWNSRGVSYVQLGQMNKAVADFSKAVELDPTLTTAWLFRASTNVELKQWDAAIADLSKVIQLDPTNCKAWTTRGMAYDNLGQTDKALADLNKSIELEPKDETLWNNRGVLHWKLGHLPEAVADCSKAIEVNPKLADAWSTRGMALAAQGQFDQSIEDLNRAIELDPNLVDAWSNRGQSLFAVGQHDKALADFSKAIELDPNDAIKWRNRGLAYTNLKRWDKAIADFSKVLELTPGDVVTLNGLAALLATCPDTKFRDPERAVELSRKAAELQPTDVATLQTQGWVNYRAGQWKQSIASFEKSMALQETPRGGDSGQWFGLAAAHWQLGEKEEARKWYDQAVEWMNKNGPNDKSFIQYRAEVGELLKTEKKATPQ